MYDDLPVPTTAALGAGGAATAGLLDLPVLGLIVLGLIVAAAVLALRRRPADD